MTGLEVAVIGMSGRFPKCDNLEEFWSKLLNGEELISRFTEEELLQQGIPEELLKKENYVKSKGIINDVDCFDNNFFDYSNSDAEIMDPQIRIFHEEVWKAIEDAGYNIKNYQANIGVYAASSSNFNWVSKFLGEKTGLANEFLAKLLNDKDFLSTRVSYKLGLTGPSFTLQSACSSSLVAIHLAVQGLLSGDCDISVAGGVRINLPYKSGYLYQESMIFSPDGNCKVFDDEAKGTCFSDGVGVVVLKRLEEAINDGDNIYAVIKGSAINNDGDRKIAYSAPSVRGQSDVIKTALQITEVIPETISYVEAHGTGTIIGDPIEVEALSRAFNTDKKNYCAIGSVKSNIGHLEVAAGVASFIKTVLLLKNRTLVPSINYKNPNPKIKFFDTPFYVNTETKKWESQYPLRAGVSSFGVGGTNSHIILEESPQCEYSHSKKKSNLFIISAKTKNALDKNTLNLSKYLTEAENTDLNDIAYTLQTGRSEFRNRRFIVSDDLKLSARILEEMNPIDTFSGVTDEIKRKNIFMFTGQGSQYINMTSRLYLENEYFQKEADNCFDFLKKRFGIDYKEMLYDNNKIDISNTKNAQLLLFTVEYSLAKYLIKLGISPDIMIGHSIGEYVAACLSGVFTLEEALEIVYYRGKLMEKTPEGVMLSIGIDSSTLKEYLHEFPGIEISAINSSSLCVVSGKEIDIAAFEKFIKEKHIYFKRLHTNHAFHSKMMEDILNEFYEILSKFDFKEPKIPFISNLSGNFINGEEIRNPKYWINHLRESVNFDAGLKKLLEENNLNLIEIGPGKVLTTFVRQHKQKNETHNCINLIRSTQEDVSDMHYFLKGLGNLWLKGNEIKWENLYFNEKRKKVSLPTYSFEKTKFSIDVSDSLIEKNDFSREPFRKTKSLENSEIEIIAEKTQLQNEIEHIFKEILGMNQVGLYDNFFELGGDSLKLIVLLNKIEEKLKYKFSIADLVKNSTIYQIENTIKSKNIQDTTFEIEMVEADTKNLNVPFALTEVQNAYLIGRNSHLELGGISTYFYFEIDAEIDIDKFEDSFNKVIRKHPMLRAIFEDNTQKILPETPKYNISVENLMIFSKDEIEKTILTERKSMSQKIFEVNKWPLFEVKAYQMGENKYKVFFGIDLLLADAGSLQIIGKDIADYYFNPNLEEENIEFSFRDYVLAYEKIKESPLYKTSKEYWINKIHDFPKAPSLPLKLKPEEIEKPIFAQHRKVFDKESLLKLRATAKSKGITLSALLVSIYADVLSLWSNQKELAINLTVFNRYPFSKDVNKIVGDFTTLLLLGIKSDRNENIWAKSQNTQNLIFEALDNRYYDAVEFTREIAKYYKLGSKPVMPVVFTSMLFGEDRLEKSWFDIGEIVNSYSQTPQVFIDNQVSDFNNELLITWDYVEQLFEKEIIDKIFEQYVSGIQSVIENNYTMSVDIESLEIIKKYNNTQKQFEFSSLHSAFMEQCNKTPENIAVICKEERITYKELNEKSNQVCNYLKNKGVIKGEHVMLVSSRKIQTIVNIIGILKAGAAYVPVDIDYPQLRKDYIKENSNSNITLSDDSYVWEQFSKYSKTFDETDDCLEELAYVIYTSGSTGNPKGVKISHKSVINTILDINSKFGISENEKIIALSSICFDLSVYDIFGALSTGASLVLVENQRDPEEIIKILDKEKISLWNSVPAIMEMLIQNIPASYKNTKIRNILLSGDWIGLKLPQKIKEHFPLAKITSLGGATEVSIWSIYYPIDNIDRNWKSIPYGYPLGNQSVYILDKNFEYCPVGVEGEIFIGGVGVAQGYLNDEKKTAESFIEHPFLGQIYKTGDYGILNKNFYIEFLGRKDNQVKIRGYRIEIGEIENCILENKNIKNVIVSDFDENNRKFLAAYYISDTSLDISELRNFLAKKLPDYMIPSYFIKIEKIPLSPNGKVDKNKLIKPDLSEVKTGINSYFRDEYDRKIIEIWKEILGEIQIGIDDSFFELGGDSLQIYKVATRVESEFKIKLPLEELYRKPYIRDISDIIKQSLSIETIEIDDEKYYWSPMAFWKTKEDKIVILNSSYEDFGVFPEFYYLLQDGADLNQIKNKFSNIENDKLDKFIQNLIKNKILIKDLLEPAELFKTQEKLFKNSYEEEIKFNSDKYHEFKEEKLKRKVKSNFDKIIELSDEKLPENILKRKSHRLFDENQIIEFEIFSKLFGIFRQWETEDLKKYSYSSAGGLYPIDVYIYIKEDRVENLSEGLYYYNPLEHSFSLMSADKINDEAHFFKNKSIFNSSAFSVFLVYDANVNMPIYSSSGYFYAILDSGIMTAMFNQFGDDLDIGMCSIGDMDFKKIEKSFGFEKNKILIHTIECGLKKD